MTADASRTTLRVTLDLGTAVSIDFVRQEYATRNMLGKVCLYFRNQPEAKPELLVCDSWGVLFRLGRSTINPTV